MRMCSEDEDIQYGCVTSSGSRLGDFFVYSTSGKGETITYDSIWYEKASSRPGPKEPNGQIVAFLQLYIIKSVVLSLVLVC